jgi:acyl-CoA oxidase
VILYLFLFLSAEDWLKPNVVIEAFEARAARMSFTVAQNLSKFTDPEEGK